MANFEDLLALIIEDNPGDSKILAFLLNRLGFQCATLDGYGVRDALSEAPVPDLIFLDLEMPELNGYQVLKELKSIPDFAGVPVVAYTSHTSEMAAARDAGFHSFLGKPLESAEFRKQVEQIVSGSSVWEVRE